MESRRIAPLVAVVAVLAASEALAYSVSMTHRNPGGVLFGSDTVIMDVFLDAEPGLTFFSVGVLYQEDVWDYDPVASALLPASGSAGPGAQPSYILYTPGGGIGNPATVLYPNQTPAWLNWPGSPPAAGLGQINIDYIEPAFNQAAASGTGIWIGSLVFHLDPMAFDFFSTFELTVSADGNIFQTDHVLDPSEIGLSAPVLVFLPEPNAAVLIALAFVGARVAARRSRSTQGRSAPALWTDPESS